MNRLQVFQAVHTALKNRPQQLITGTLRDKYGNHCALGVAVADCRLSAQQAVGSIWELTRVYLLGRPARRPEAEIAFKNDRFDGTPTERYYFMLSWLGNEIAKMQEHKGTPLPVPSWVQGFFPRPKSRV